MLGEPRIHVEETESTQLLLDPSLPEGAIATALHRTGGRGRLGRTWHDVPGASLRSLDGRERDVEELLAAVLHELDDAYGTWLDDGLAALYPEIAARDALRGTALYAGIRPDGRLELANGELMESGEIPGDVDVA